VNFPNPKEIALSERQNNFDAISNFWRPEKPNFRIRKKSLFYGVYFLRFGAMKKRISRMPKKSLFHSTNTTLKRFLAF
jgi:hypothetical protein